MTCLLLTSSPVHATGSRLERPVSSLVTVSSVVATVTFSSASMSDGWLDLLQLGPMSWQQLLRGPSRVESRAGLGLFQIGLFKF